MSDYTEYKSSINKLLTKGKNKHSCTSDMSVLARRIEGYFNYCMEADNKFDKFLYIFKCFKQLRICKDAKEIVLKELKAKKSFLFQMIGVVIEDDYMSIGSFIKKLDSLRLINNKDEIDKKLIHTQKKIITTQNSIQHIESLIENLLTVFNQYKKNPSQYLLYDGEGFNLYNLSVIPENIQELTKYQKSMEVHSYDTCENNFQMFAIEISKYINNNRRDMAHLKIKNCILSRENAQRIRRRKGKYQDEEHEAAISILKELKNNLDGYEKDDIVMFVKSKFVSIKKTKYYMKITTDDLFSMDERHRKTLPEPYKSFIDYDKIFVKQNQELYNVFIQEDNLNKEKKDLYKKIENIENIINTERETTKRELGISREMKNRMRKEKQIKDKLFDKDNEQNKIKKLQQTIQQIDIKLQMANDALDENSKNIEKYMIMEEELFQKIEKIKKKLHLPSDQLHDTQLYMKTQNGNEKVSIEYKKIIPIFYASNGSKITNKLKRDNVLYQIFYDEQNRPLLVFYDEIGRVIKLSYDGFMSDINIAYKDIDLRLFDEDEILKMNIYDRYIPRQTTQDEQGRTVYISFNKNGTLSMLYYDDDEGKNMIVEYNDYVKDINKYEDEVFSVRNILFQLAEAVKTIRETEEKSYDKISQTENEINICFNNIDKINSEIEDITKNIDMIDNKIREIEERAEESLSYLYDEIKEIEISIENVDNVLNKWEEKRNNILSIYEYELLKLEKEINEKLKKRKI